MRLNIPLYEFVVDLVVARDDNFLSYLFVAADIDAVDTDLTATLADIAAEKLAA